VNAKLARLLRSVPPRLAAAQRWLRPLCFATAGILVSGCTQLAFVTANLAAGWSDFSRKTNLAYGPSKDQRLDLYLPAHPAHCPIVVFFYGGGWNSGDKASYKFVGAALASAGYIAVLPNYSLYPKARFPVFMLDAARAVAWAREHAADWGGDRSKLYVAGHSAGAHIAIMLALDEEYLEQVGGSSKWLQGAIGLSGPYDFLPFTEPYLNDLFGPQSNFPSSQPINFVRGDTPRLLLMHGTADKRVSVNNTHSLEQALRTVGAPVTAIYFKGASHGDLAAALSVPARHRLPVLIDIVTFIGGQDPGPQAQPADRALH
jgi:acetyl esterase/lipase